MSLLHTLCSRVARIARGARGYNKFVTLESLLDPARGFLVDDALTVSVEELRITRS
jgi:hypothetical protein